jgi:hypothetical protein
MIPETPTRIATKIRLLRDGHLKHASFLLVEGDTDKLFCELYVVDKSSCEVIPANGRLNVIEVLTILEKDNFSGVLAIADADFEVLRGIAPDRVNLFFTDTHDLETMILKSEALDKFLSGYGDTEKIVAFEKTACKRVREILLETGRWVGYLRWISLEEGLHLAFEKLPFNNFVDIGTLSLDLDKLVKAVIGFAKQPLPLSAAELKQKILDKVNSQHELWYVCQGHDLIEILAIGMRQTFAGLSKREVHADKLEKNLMLAYEKRWFNETQLYLSLSHWEDHNLPFKVRATVGK